MMLSDSPLSGVPLSAVLHTDTAVYSGSVTMAIGTAISESSILTTFGTLTLSQALAIIESYQPSTFSVSLSLAIGAAQAQAGLMTTAGALTLSGALAFADSVQVQTFGALTLAILEDFVALGHVPGPPTAAFTNRTLSLPLLASPILSQPGLASAALALPSFSSESLES